MSQLIALVIAIVLGAVVTAIGYVLLGGIFADQSVKAEAQKILVQAEQIEAAMVAYKVDHGGLIKLGPSDPNGDGDFSDNEIFAYLVEEGYLKQDVNLTLSDLSLSWHYEECPDGVTTEDCEAQGKGIIQRVVKESKQCLEANHQRNRLPKKGVDDGFTMQNKTIIVNASDEETYSVAYNAIGGVPVCGNVSAEGVACCIEP